MYVRLLLILGLVFIVWPLMTVIFGMFIGPIAFPAAGLLCLGIWLNCINTKTNEELDKGDDLLSDDEFEAKYSMTRKESEEEFEYTKKDFKKVKKDVKSVFSNAVSSWRKPENKQARKELYSEARTGTVNFFGWAKDTFEDWERKNDKKRIARKRK